jgi:hypothetical protein
LQREEAYLGILGSGGVPGNKPISKMTEEELKAAFGPDAARLKQIGDRQPDLTVAEIQPLRKMRGFQKVLELLAERPDMKLEEAVPTGADGRRRIDPSVTNPQSLRLMQTRPDIRPGVLKSLAADLFHSLGGDPALTREAYRASLGVLGSRPDLRPADLAGLMRKASQEGAGPAQALDRFRKSSQLLSQGAGVEDAARQPGPAPGGNPAERPPVGA